MSRSKRYAAAKALVEQGKKYPPAEALALSKKMAEGKDQAVELHLKLGVNPKKAEEIVRGVVDLPHGSGKTVRIAAFVKADLVEAVTAAGADLVGGEELIKEIKSSQKIAFDVAVAQPEFMKALGPIAKLLGQQGLMPNPKDETVTTNPAKTVAALKHGRVSFRSDETGNVHLTLGRTSFSDAQLVENCAAALEAIKRAKPAAAKGTYLRSVTIATTFGPGIPIAA